MGAYLSSPIVEKDGEGGENDFFEMGCTSMQGWRVDNEDAHVATLRVADNSGKAVGVFGVFDGHGGREVSQFCARHWVTVWESTNAYRSGDIPRSLVESYLKMDDTLLLEENASELDELTKKRDDGGNNGGDGQMVSKVQIRQILMGLRGNMEEAAGPATSAAGEAPADPPGGASGASPLDWSAVDSGPPRRTHGPSAGCTAVVAIATAEGELFVANAGDSRCVFSRNGKAVEMSHDHKPDEAREAERIHRAGAFVTDGRVNGSLNLSRAIGDMEYKQRRDLKPEQHAVTAYPDVRRILMTDEDEFFVLACDGIWDVLSNQEAVDFVKDRIGRMPLQKICEEACDECLAPNTNGTGKGCDNMTIMIVRMKDAIKVKDKATKDIGPSQIIG